eukprot:TRINITY_DN11980_c0_g1_i1.p1 TRINITY_DN11980_c0_g1~~TRINITY_DN11980_c0_g1_i1.p1  ORF type:complete len:390 (+),score=115.90 TRINITY_DN11980_c0_g1_i1:110-1279(+)
MGGSRGGSGGKAKGKSKGEGSYGDWEESSKGQKGKGKGKGKGDGKRSSDEGKGKGRGDWQPKDQGDGGARSTLSSHASEFKPSGLGDSGGGYGSYVDYNSMAAQYWDWSSMVQTMPPLWREYADKDGEKYYYNAKTGLCQWERPAELDAPPPPPVEPVMPTGAASGSGGGSGGDQRRSDKEDLRRMRNDNNRDRGDNDGGKGGSKGKTRRKKGDDGNRGGGGGGAKGGGGGGYKQEEASFGPPGCNLFVFHLPDDWIDDDLLEYFAPHGTVVSAKVMKELGTGRSRGFGFVSYEDRVSAATAIKKMQGYKVLGKRLKVEFKKGEHEDDDNEGVDEESARRSSADDERLIGYLRAISAKNVVQSLKESGKDDEDDDDNKEEGQGQDEDDA